MSLLKYLCDVKHFPILEGQSLADATDDFLKLEKSRYHMHDRFPTTFSGFSKWIRKSPKRTSRHHANHCANFTDGQLETLFQMLRPEPWNRKSASDLLQMPLFDARSAAVVASTSVRSEKLSKGAKEAAENDAKRFAIAPLLESGLVDLPTFLSYKDILSNTPSTRWKVGKKDFLPHNTWLSADEKGLRLDWKRAENQNPRYLHLGYVGPVEVSGTKAFPKVSIYVNRIEPNCTPQITHDRSCKHPEGHALPTRRTWPLQISFQGERANEDANAFAEALRSLAAIQKAVSPLSGAASDDFIRNEKSKRKKNSNKLVVKAKAGAAPKVVSGPKPSAQQPKVSRNGKGRKSR